jgi:coatomer subunit alpha
VKRLLTCLQAKQVIKTAAQYALGMSIELQRRKITDNKPDISSLSDEDKKRSLELSAYFTIAELEPSHKTLALYAAMNFANKNKQLSSALSFANALIDKGTNAKFKETVREEITLSK